MLLIVGQDVGCAADWTVRDLDHPGLDLREDTEPAAPRVYWPMSYWPEVRALVEFDKERQRLRLSSLEHAPVH